MAIVVILGIVFISLVASKIERKRDKEYMEKTNKQISETAKWWYNKR